MPREARGAKPFIVCRQLVPSPRGAQAESSELGAQHPKGGKVEAEGSIAGSQEECQEELDKPNGHQPLQGAFHEAGSRATSGPPEPINPFRFLGARLGGGQRVRGVGYKMHEELKVIKQTWQLQPHGHSTGEEVVDT